MTLWDVLRPITNAIKALGKPAPTKRTKRPTKEASAKLSPSIAIGPKVVKKSGQRRPKPRPAPISAALAPQKASGGNQKPNHRHLAKPAEGIKPQTAQERYDQVVQEMLAKYGVRVKRWRKSMSGVAFVLRYRDGSTAKFIESPQPKSPMSMAIFLHEIGHHAIGLGIHKPRCLEEYLAWKFSIEQLEVLGLPVTERVHVRMRRSLEYAVAKARRRGIRAIPRQLAAYDK